MPHHTGDSLIALAFPRLRWVGFVPGFIELAVLLGQFEAVLLAHIEVGACDHPANRWPRHDLLGLEVHLGQA